MSKGLNGGGLVVFLDQMEELFTVRDRAQAHAFLSALYRAANPGTLNVIATIRSDFVHHCYEHEDLLRVLNGRGHIRLGPIDVISVHEMISKPAQCAGLSIPERLVRRLAGETGQEPGSLPLLAFALRELFENRDGNELTEKTYKELGGLAGAMRKHVKTVEEKVATSFRITEKDVYSKIFGPLVVVNLDGQPTRRRTAKESFGADLRTVIDVLIKERLLNAEGEGHESVVSVAHEKLFEAWPTLARWIADNRNDLFVLRQAEIEAGEWEWHGYDLKYLWHEDRLKRLQELIKRFGAEQVNDAVRLYAAPQNSLIERLSDNSLWHQERLTIGRYLAALGDSRPGVGLREDGLPDIEWIEIPGGQVTLEEVEHPFKVKAFRMARYLVTNMQFEAFVNAENGYRNKEWWKGIQRSEAPAPPSWNEANAPRETVSWFEAVAFCRWLSQRTGSNIRLPAEWEWQQAVTGGEPKREYPWPGGWDATRCNSDESRLNRTSAVGMYPSGGTQQGVLDMAGNVDEWCLNTYDKPEPPDSLRIVDTDARRVGRGGSWGSLRSSYRNWNFAAYRSGTIGFRLAQGTR